MKKPKEWILIIESMVRKHSDGISPSLTQWGERVVLRCLLAGLVVLGLSSCATLVSNATNQLTDNLSAAILDSDDVETIKEAIPAYLVLIDSLVVGERPSPSLLLAAAKLNGAFAVLVSAERSQKLTTKALNYSRRGACLESESLCDLAAIDYAVFEQRVKTLEPDEIAPAFALAVAWTSWIQAHSADWAAVGQLARVKGLMNRVIELDDGFDDGGAHLYMGGLETVLPASMGGNPEKGRGHFEKAIEYSEGRFLMAKVVYAEQYAKLMFDQALHDKLLEEVVSADPVAPNLTLINTVAQEQARQLLLESNDYF
jgi:hypothetical protein